MAKLASNNRQVWFHQKLWNLGKIEKDIAEIKQWGFSSRRTKIAIKILQSSVVTQMRYVGFYSIFFASFL